MFEQRIIDAAVETINTTRRQAYGVQCTCLNYEADAAVPLYTTPYEQVEFADVANDIFAYGDDDDDMMYYRHLDCFSTCISGIEHVSPSVLHGIMECMKLIAKAL